jgi:hypothetical protein
VRVVFESDVELSAYIPDASRPVVSGDRILCAGGGVVDGGISALMCACDLKSGTVQSMTFLDGLSDGALIAASPPVVLDDERTAQAIVAPGLFVKLVVVDRSMQIVYARDLTFDDHTMPDLIALDAGMPTFVELHAVDDGGVLLHIAGDGRSWVRRLRDDFTPAWSSTERLAGIADNIAIFEDRQGSVRAVDLESGVERWRSVLHANEGVVNVDRGTFLVIETDGYGLTFEARLMAVSTARLIAEATLDGMFWRGHAATRGLCVAFSEERETFAWQLQPFREWRVTSDAIALRDDLLICEGHLVILDDQRAKPRRLRLDLGLAPSATIDGDLIVIRDHTRLVGVRVP